MLPFRTILCALDFSEGSGRALVRAADLAERAHADLHLLHVDPTFRARLAQVPGGDVHSTFLARLRAYVNTTLGDEDAYDVLAPEAHVTHGEAPADGILRFAEASGADLIVVGTHSRKGLGHLFMGSVAADVLRRSEKPVLVVPERAETQGPGPDRPILVAVDFSSHTPLAMTIAAGLAETYGAPIELVHVLEEALDTPLDFGGLFTLDDLRSEPEATARTVAHRALQHVGASTSVSIRERHVATGVAETEILRLAETRHAGAVVMGTHGRTGFSRVVLGSVAEWTVRHAPCAVLAIPAKLAAVSPEAPAQRSEAA